MFVMFGYFNKFKRNPINIRCVKMFWKCT